MSDSISKPSGGFVGGVGQNIVANLCATILGAACVRFGITRERFEDLSNWPVWLALLGGLAVLGFGLNAVRLTAKRVHARRRVRAASSGKLAVLIAKLQNDGPDNPVREVIREAIKRELGDAIELLVWPETLALTGGHDADAQQQAIKTARRWISQKRCDLLLWGRVKASNVVSLRVTGLAIDSGNPTSYVLDEALELPTDFVSDLGSAIAAHLTSQALPAIADSGRYLAPMVADLLDRLAPLAREVDPTWDGNTRGAIKHAYAQLRHTLGEQSGRDEDLEAAMFAYRAALSELPRERAPLWWASTQNSIGNALRILGEREVSSGTAAARERGIARLREAIAVFRAALEERTRERAPLAWAGTQSDLGSALARLGEYERNPALLRDAVFAFRAVLDEFTRERAPLAWARTQNNLGLALLTLGEFEESTTRLRDGVGALRATLEVVEAKHMPYRWAMVKGNLGLGLRRLGELEGSTSLLTQAADEFRASAKQFKREGATRDWIMAQNDLGKSLRTLGELMGERGIKSLRKAVSTFRSVLKVVTPESDPRLWADTQNYLGAALATLGQKEGQTSQLEQAALSFRAAVEERRRQRQPLLCAGAQKNLAIVLLELGQRSHDRNRLEEALVAVEEASSVYKQSGAAADSRELDGLRANVLTSLGARE